MSTYVVTCHSLSPLCLRTASPLIACTPVCNNVLMSLSLGPSVPVVLLYHTLALCHSSGVECFTELQVSINWLSFVVVAQLILYCTEHFGSIVQVGCCHGNRMKQSQVMMSLLVIASLCCPYNCDPPVHSGQPIPPHVWRECASTQYSLEGFLSINHMVYVEFSNEQNVLTPKGPSSVAIGYKKTEHSR